MVLLLELDEGSCVIQTLDISKPRDGTHQHCHQCLAMLILVSAAACWFRVYEPSVLFATDSASIKDI